MGKKTNIPTHLKNVVKGVLKNTTVGGGVNIGDDEFATVPSGSLSLGKGNKKANISLSKPYLKKSKQNINSTIGLGFTKEGENSSFSVEGSKTGKAKNLGISFSKTFNKGGASMLKGNQVKLDKNKDGKISGKDFKMMKSKKGSMAQKKPGGAIIGTLALGLLGQKFLKSKNSKTVSPNSTTGLLPKMLKDAKDKNNKETEQKKARHGKMITARSGKMMKARTESNKYSNEKRKLNTSLIKKMSGAAISESEATAITKASKKMNNTQLKNKIKNMNVGGYMKKANRGMMMEKPSTRGFGAARTSGMGLENESLQPGKIYDKVKARKGKMAKASMGEFVTVSEYSEDLI